MSEGPDRSRKVQLEAAVEMISGHIARTVQSGGLQADAVSLELQFSLEEQDGKVIPVVPLDAVPTGQPVHRLRFDFGVSEGAIDRPDTSQGMIMDHPPPREVQEVGVAVSESSKPAVDGQHGAPPQQRGQEVAVTLSERSKPVIDGGVPLSEVIKPAMEGKADDPLPQKKEPPSQVQSHPKPSQEAKKTTHDLESKFAMLDQMGSGEDGDFEAEETTVTDTIPEERGPRDRGPNGRKKPKIVLPTNPRLKLRKASDTKESRPQATPTPEPADEKPASRAHIDFEPPRLDEKVPRKDATEEVVAQLSVNQRFIVFDHQKARRRPEPSKNGKTGKPKEDDGSSSSGRAGAEG